MANSGSAPARMADRQRARRSEMVREEVIEAALAEFAARGYHQTSIADIAKRLGTGHSMFYRYFVNKRDILEHVMRYTRERFQSAITETLPNELSSLEDFRQYAVRLGMTCIELVVEDSRLARLMVLQADGVDQEMTDQFRQAFDGGAAALALMLQAGVAAGFVRGDIDTAATADSVVAIPFGLLLRYGQEPDRDVLADRVTATVDLVCRAIALPGVYEGETVR